MLSKRMSVTQPAYYGPREPPVPGPVKWLDNIAALASEDNRRMPVYMVIERFKNADPLPVYRRFREQGRLMPEGLTYVSSWVEPALDQCYQVMEADDRALLDRWMLNWQDLVDFEVHEVITSAEAAAQVAPRL